MLIISDSILLQKDKVFSDTSKYDDVKVSELTVKKKGDRILVEFKLCLVMQDAKEGYLEDELKKWKKFVNESVTEVDFGASGELILALYIY